MQKFYDKHIGTFNRIYRYRFNQMLLNGKYKSLYEKWTMAVVEPLRAYPKSQ